MLHGFGGSKTDFQGPAPARYNATYFASKGYAVVLPSARGFGRSCGVPDSRTAGLRARLDPPRRSALRGARRPMAARTARRPARGAARRPRGDRHLLWRRHVAGARHAGRSHPPTRRRHGVLAVARRRAARHRGRVATLAVERPRRRAHAQRAPGTAHLRLARRRRDPGLRGRALRSGHHERLRGAPGRRPRGRPHGLEAACRSRRALRRRRTRDPQQVPHLPRRPRPADRQGDHAAARPVRLDRRPVPRRPGPADLRPPAPEEQDGAGRAAARRPRALARGQPSRRHRGLQRPGPLVLRCAAEARGQEPRARQRDRLHPDLPEDRRPRRWSVPRVVVRVAGRAARSSSATRPPSA